MPRNLKTIAPSWSQTRSISNSSPVPKSRTNRSWAKRSGLLDSETAVSSPRLPRGRARTATVVQSSASSPTGASLFKDLQREAAVQLHAGRTQNGADGTRRPPLLADHLAQVAGRDLQLQHG